ncbi:hypothetical protein BC777_0943 [Yoonia maricola]|uniref:Lipoprotein n=1 Tax=Yoonia maricola TaxID=420999 RepID=A0A2M8WME6_9RHOB|nr:hypothetical protein BC777_0943 [Yoonia maricola]
MVPRDKREGNEMSFVSKYVVTACIALGLAACSGGLNPTTTERHFSSSVPVLSGGEVTLEDKAPFDDPAGDATYR